MTTLLELIECQERESEDLSRQISNEVSSASSTWDQWRASVQGKLQQRSLEMIHESEYRKFISEKDNEK